MALHYTSDTILSFDVRRPKRNPVSAWVEESGRIIQNNTFLYWWDLRGKLVPRQQIESEVQRPDGY